MALPYIGRSVTLTIDRPYGSAHPVHGFRYGANYGYVPGTLAPDGEELDAYLLGPTEPLDHAEGTCVGVIHRLDDDDDKLVVVPDGYHLTDSEILAAVAFQEPPGRHRLLRSRHEPSTNSGTHVMDITTALLVPMTAAGNEIADLRHLDPAAGFGLPAHVTVLYPFGPVDLLDEALRSELRRVFAAEAPFEVEFRRSQWFGDEVLWLAPEDPRPFVALTEAVTSAYPAWQPYGGAFETVIPHLTVGDITEAAGRLSSVEELRAAEAALAGRLPLRDVADRVLLMAGKREANSWRALEEFRLGLGRLVPDDGLRTGERAHTEKDPVE
jgi:inorganic pyrophosphatase